MKKIDELAELFRAASIRVDNLSAMNQPLEEPGRTQAALDYHAAVENMAAAKRAWLAEYRATTSTALASENTQ